MNKKSLEKELKRLKNYIKESTIETNISPYQSKLISHTIVGMIMTINNLIKTGAYTQMDFSSEELFSLIEEARNSAIHYGFFNDFSNINTKANNIISKIPDSLSNNFATYITTLEYNENETYSQVYSSEFSSIFESIALDDYYTLKNIKTNEQINIKKEDLLIVENELNHQKSYLLKNSDSPILFYKKSSNDETIKISTNDFYKLSFAKSFKIINKGHKFSQSISKLLTELKDNPYKNLLLSYKYDNKIKSIPVHTLLSDLLYKRKIEEKILNGKFHLIQYQDISKIDQLNFSSLSIKDMVNAASIADIFYIELYLKRFKAYLELKESLSSKNIEISDYARQSLLISLFQVGPSAFSSKFIESDKSKNFINFYYEFKNSRNELAHSAITNKDNKQNLINNLELYASTLYTILEQVYNNYYKQKIKTPHLKLPSLKNYDSNHLIINNKTTKFIELEHCSICKIIDGKKYLKLNVDPNHTYVEIDGTLFSLDYNCLIAKKCLIPLDHARFVQIDPNTNRIKQAHFSIASNTPLYIDQYLETLMQAHDLFKTYPQYNKKYNPHQFIAITYLNKHNQATYTEGIKNVIYRRLSQKIIPNQLKEATSLIISKNIDEPLQILNKNKEVIAKVYLASINTINNHQVIKQLLQDSSQQDIDYGKLLPKDLRTNEIIITNKEGRK